MKRFISFFSKFTLFCLLAVVFVGCGTSGAKRVSVEGTVTFQGKPVTNATVIIRPEAGPDAGGITDANGKFLIPRDEGPMAGNVRIMVEKFEEAQEKGSDGRMTTVSKPALPDNVQSKLNPYTLKDGKNTLEINLDK